MNQSLNVFAVGFAFVSMNVPAHAEHFIALYNNSSVTIQELYVGDFKSWDEMLKGRPDEVDGVLLSGESTQIQPVYHEVHSNCVTNLIVTTNQNTVLVRGVDICTDILTLTDYDLSGNN